MLKTVYLQNSQRWTREPHLLLRRSGATIAAGSIILLSGVKQPLLLLMIAACLNGMVMFVYSHPAHPAEPARAAAGHCACAASASAMLVFATLFYGFFAGWLVIVQVRAYLAGRLAVRSRRSGADRYG